MIPDNLIQLILRASWQAGVIVVLVLILQRTIARRWQPRWRHALWWLVVARLAFPVTPPSAISLFNLFPAANSVSRSEPADSVNASAEAGGPEDWKATFETVSSDTRISSISPRFGIWAAGAGAMAACIAFNHYRLHRRVTRRRPLINEGVLNLLEDCKQSIGVRAPVTVVETREVDGPCLFGVMRPRLLLPPGLTGGFSTAELRCVFLHELGHIKRLDIAQAWLMTILQILHWFNPLVWVAFSRMRIDRELACDALALAHTDEKERASYGRTIVKLLENFGQTAPIPGLAGILEDKNQIKERIIMITKFKNPGKGAALAGLLLGAMALVTLTDAQTNSDSAPHLVSTSPKIGATDVDPSISEITATFDRDMDSGMSWTGGGPEFPRIPEGQKPHWKDKRTCILPVKLVPGHSYRVGINSVSFQNFRDENGKAAAPAAIIFRTSGTAAEPKMPQIVSMTPENGAKDVDPSITELRIVFDTPMGGGFSWVGGGPNFPEIPDGRKPYWSKDRKTCILPVALKPDWEYKLGLNSPSHRNFQSQDGVALRPTAYGFKTAAGK